ncbi:hypothetical protein PFLUV_G00005420 [Perca fluviatilis]|uniref:Centriolar coiled-coil protein of 110 kDa n=1 Tax=Perca fluviatilis TaxID=8168 RepID=A0A6A5FJ81_PERFL|nr:uncharacterized protein si:ch73-100l22.3 isoform X1 [Perca fluviatilis]KAF1394850.1 hypothetical protein PFLUV_G00005420 [Perca fluviatilis]
MEDYDKFVQHRLSHLRKSEEGHGKPLPASSLIRFYGQPVLPPLLSGEQREEMQRHRDAAQKAAVHRKLKEDSRMAYVQTILHSVQLRKTPTLEELLQESEINTKSSYSHNTSGGSVSRSNSFIGPKDSLSLSPPGRKEQDGVSLPPLTSTTYSAFFTSNVTPQQSYQERCLIDQHYNQHGSQPSSLNGVSHQSSGYLTLDKFENTPSVSERIHAERESHGFGSSDGAYENNMGGFFLHNTSNTIAKMPDIISHPPIDGEELERSGLESSICNNIIVVKDICCTLLQEDSVICDHLPVEKSDSSHLDSTKGEVNLPFTTVLGTEEDHSLDRIEGPVSSSENSDISDNLESSQTSSTHCIPTTELHIPHDPRESEPADNHVDEAQPSEEPHRLSLQALLKKSQEYRRRQRMLRNQAKNTKIQERTQEQTRAEEQSLSDKENDEFPYMGTVTADGKKTQERRGTLIQSVETSQNKSWENERVVESEFFGGKANFKSESSHLTGDGKPKEMTSVEEETILKNNKLNISQEVITEPQQISAFPQQQQPTSIETSPVQEAFHLTTCPAAFYSAVGKYHTIPAPNFCRSPVHRKSKGSIQDGDDGDDGEAVAAAKTSKRKVLVDSGLIEDHKVDEVILGHKTSNSAVPFTVNLMVEGDVTSVTARSSQHIDQLESNLSSLKVMISDLESTLTGNLKNRSQTESNTRSEVTFKGIKHSRQSDCDYWEDKPRNDDGSNEAEQDQRYREWQRRQLLDNFKNMQEDTETELSISDTDNVSLIVQVKETDAVNVSELRLVKTLATERAKEKGTCNEGPAKSYGQRGGSKKPTAKRVLSVTQQQRIPDVFRNVPSATTASPNVSVPLDTSNHPVESRNETAADAHDSTHSPSINQSYDVEAPSGLWLLEGSGSDMGSKGHLVQEEHLTPESGGESHGGVSKVKRRLLMHVTEETGERSADVSRGATSVVRPNASTPRDAQPLAAVRWYEGHGGQDKQEHLKQTHAAQVRALQEEHRRQQAELLQALAVRYRLLQSVSFPCSMSSSRLGDTLTISTLSQPSSPLSGRCRPLLLAAVKGFLARRLLKTERVAQLVRTIGDTHQFLQALQQQSPGRGKFCSRQDLLLQERVTLQLRAARYEVHDIFFSLSAGERMQLINWDRELARERELRRQSGHTGNPRGKSSLSTATQKSLERKRGMMIQKKVVERHTGVVTRTGHNTGFSAEQLPETKRGQFRANPQRVPKSTHSSRPR